jgi:hypothetical protein
LSIIGIGGTQIETYLLIVDAAEPWRSSGHLMDPLEMHAARLFRIADKVMMTVITVALIVGVPVSAITFVVQTL